MGCPLLDDASLTGRLSGIGTGANRKSAQSRVYLCAGERLSRRDLSELFEIALVFVRLDHVARLIVNANHGMM